MWLIKPPGRFQRFEIFPKSVLDITWSDFTYTLTVSESHVRHPSVKMRRSTPEPAEQAVGQGDVIALQASISAIPTKFTGVLNK